MLIALPLLLWGCEKEAEIPVQDTSKPELSQTKDPATGTGRATITVEGRDFQVEIADTVAKRQMGLMNRTELAEGEGMLFTFEKPGKHRFWMKDTLIPLDIIWLDVDYNVVTKITAPPCTADPCPKFSPEGPASFVLEVKGGSF